MTFIEKHKLPKMTQEETENLNINVLNGICNANVPLKKASSLNGFSDEPHRTSKENCSASSSSNGGGSNRRGSSNASQRTGQKETDPSTAPRPVSPPQNRFMRKGSFRQIITHGKEVPKNV